MCTNSHGEGMKRRVGLFSIVPSDITGMEVVKFGYQLPREMLKSPSVDVHKTQLDICSKWPCSSKRVGPGGLKRVLLSQAIMKTLSCKGEKKSVKKKLLHFPE